MAIKYNKVLFVVFSTLLFSCGNLKKQTATEAAMQPVGPAFSADSAYAFCAD